MNSPSYLRWRFAQLRALTLGLRSAWRRTWRLGIGDRAKTAGRTVLLTNGVCAPTWDCQDIATGEYLRVGEQDMRKVRSITNYIGSFRSGWRWWYGYWFHIDVGRLLGHPGAFYGTPGAMARRQRRFERRYQRNAAKRAAARRAAGGAA